MVGDFEVAALRDGTLDLPVEKLLHEPANKTTAALKKDYLSVPAETSANCLFVKTGPKLVLTDADAGSLFGPTLGKVVASPQVAGCKSGQVGDILMTHMHPERVGGLSANGALVFPNAVVRADKRDVGFWLSAENPAKKSVVPRGAFACSGQVLAVDPFQLLDRVEVGPRMSESTGIW